MAMCLASLGMSLKRSRFLPSGWQPVIAATTLLRACSWDLCCFVPVTDGGSHAQLIPPGAAACSPGSARVSVPQGMRPVPLLCRHSGQLHSPVAGTGASKRSAWLKTWLWLSLGKVAGMPAGRGECLEELARLSAAPSICPPMIRLWQVLDCCQADMANQTPAGPMCWSFLCEQGSLLRMHRISALCIKWTDLPIRGPTPCPSESPAIVGVSLL